jgi:anthranilate synthase component 1
MQIEPSEAAFVERYGRDEAQVVWTTLVADLETPVSAFLKLGGGKAMSFLLESVEGGAVRGRYSIIGLEPDLIWRAHASKAEVNRTARTKTDMFNRRKSDRASRQPAANVCRRIRLSWL